MKQLVNYITVMLLSSSIAAISQVSATNGGEPQSQAGAASSPGQSANESNGSEVTGDVAATRLGPVYMADRFSGMDFSAKVSACLSAVEAAGSGTCDARSLTGSQKASASITVGDGK